jgi:hypothetical protein
MSSGYLSFDLKTLKFSVSAFIEMPEEYLNTKVYVTNELYDKSMYLSIEKPKIGTTRIAKIMVVHCYMIGVLKHLNVRRFRSVHFESVIPASLVGVFLHSTPLSSLYFNPPCSLQKLKWVQ